MYFVACSMSELALANCDCASLRLDLRSTLVDAPAVWLCGCVWGAGIAKSLYDSAFDNCMIKLNSSRSRWLNLHLRFLISSHLPAHVYCVEKEVEMLCNNALQDLPFPGECCVQIRNHYNFAERGHITGMSVESTTDL